MFCMHPVAFFVKGSFHYCLTDEPVNESGIAVLIMCLFLCVSLCVCVCVCVCMQTGGGAYVQRAVGVSSAPA